MMLFCESFTLHLFVGLLLKIVPFRWIPRIFSSRYGPLPGTEIHRTPGEASGHQIETATQPEDQARHSLSGQRLIMIEKIRMAVQRAGWVSPWKNRCLVSSLAGRCMLRRRKIWSELSLGVAKNAAGKLVAHAWLKSGDFELVEKRGSYTELFLF
jgi:hypothetical protein